MFTKWEKIVFTFTLCTRLFYSSKIYLPIKEYSHVNSLHFPFIIGGIVSRHFTRSTD